MRAAPPPYQLPTFATLPSDFIAKSEGALEEIGRWYGEGAAMTPRVTDGYGDCKSAVFPP